MDAVTEGNVGELMRRVDRGQVMDTTQLASQPATAALLLIGHLKLFLDQLIALTHGMKPGRARLMLTMEIYWEGCFRRRSLRTHCLEVVREDRTAFSHVLLRGELIRHLIYCELKACGLEQPGEHALEFMRRMRDVARQELASNQRQTAARQSQYEWLDAVCHRAQYQRRQLQ